MVDHKPTAVESAVLSGVLSLPEGNALRTAHATANALRTAQTTARSPITNHPPMLRFGVAGRSRIGSRLRTSAFTLPKQRERFSAFTLAELLVSMGVLVLLILLFTQLVKSAATVTILGHKQMDADSQARELLDRMSVDFAKMVKRPDVDYYLKSSFGTASDCGVCGSQVGNDQAAFYTMMPGYYGTTPTPAPSYTQRSPLSVVTYRVNSATSSPFYNRMQRMGKGLAWNGVSPTSAWTPVVFLPQSINGNWSYATSTSLDDSSYEVIGPQIFRFEYYYLLKNGNLSSTPWYTASSVRGMRDVTAIIADIAVIDPKSKVLLTDGDLATLAGTLTDYGGSATADCPSPNWQTPGELRRQWQCTLDSTTGLPRPAISGIRVYERSFYLNQ